MRTFFEQVETGYRAIKECPFTPTHVAEVFGGYMCFESDKVIISYFKEYYPGNMVALNLIL